MASADPFSPDFRSRLVYRGDSMRGTFRAGDCLWVGPATMDSLRAGDVVAMVSGSQQIVHRIARRAGNGFRTQGDGVLRCDCELLSGDRLVGKAMVRERAGRRRAVTGGFAGRLHAGLCHGACRLRIGLFFPLAPLYRWLRATRWAARWWRPRMVSARFAGTQDTITKFIHRGRTVACWEPREGRWTCRKPYDLILAPPMEGSRR